jgi:hypothetical protein
MSPLTRTLDELIQSAMEGDPPEFSSKEERDLFEQRYAEAEPRWNRIPEARRRYLEELIEKHRDRCPDGREIAQEK